MRRIPKYITYENKKYIVQLYCRGKNKFQIINITGFNQKAVEAVIENCVNNYIKLLHKHQYTDQHMINTIIKAANAGISNKKIAQYFNLKYDTIAFIMKRYKVDMKKRHQLYNEKEHIRALNNIVLKRNIEHELAVQRRESKKKYRLQLIEQEDLKNQYLPIPIYPYKIINQNYFSNIDSEEKAYWLGFLAGDGCISKNNISLRLSFPDIHHIIKYQQALNSNHRIDYIKLKSFGISSRLYCVSICCKQLADDLKRNLVTEHKSFTVHIPNINDNLKKYYIRGLFDADGCIYHDTLYKRITVNISGNILMLQDINNYFHHYLGICTKISQSSSIYQIQFFNKKAIKILDFLYEDASVYLDRKYEKYLSIKNNIKFCSY